MIIFKNVNAHLFYRKLFSFIRSIIVNSVYKQKKISLLMSSQRHKPKSIRMYTRQSGRSTNGKISLRQNNFQNLKKQNSHYKNNQADQYLETVQSISQSFLSNKIKLNSIKIKSSIDIDCQQDKKLISQKSQATCRHKFSLKNQKNHLKQSLIFSATDISRLKVGVPAVILNLKYSDIKIKQKPVDMISFAKDLCTTGSKVQKQQIYVNPQGLLSFFQFGTKKIQHIGCKCQIRCLTIDKWLQEDGIGAIRQKQYDKKVHLRYLNQIQKDIRRTQPNQITFQSELYIARLRQTLAVYAKLDPQIGYTQGMNFIASIFVYHSPDLNTCIKLMDLFFIKKNFRSIYTNDFSQCKKHSQSIVNIIRKKCSNLYHFFVNEHQIYLQAFIQGWMFTLLGNVIPIDHMRYVIDLFMEESFRGIYKIICALLLYLYEKKQLKQLDDTMDIMQLLSIQSLIKSDINWEQLLLSSHNFPIYQKQIRTKEALFINLK